MYVLTWQSAPYNGCKMARIFGCLQQAAFEVSLKDYNNNNNNNVI
jgi:hypothetical protein